MSNEYCTTKGLHWAFLILVFIMVGVPMLIAMSYEDYPKYCKMSIILPCVGVLINEEN